MKRQYILFIALMLSLSAFSQDPVNRIRVEGPLKFDQSLFNLAWTTHPNDNYWVQEYLPGGETLDRFNQLLTISVLETKMKTKDVVKLKVEELIARKSIDPVCNYQINESPDGEEFMVDFLLGESKDGKMTVVEFNIYRYKQIEISKKKKAIILYSYSKRSYGDDITGFLKSLSKDRTKYLNEMISSEIPVVSIETEL